ncbi:hypothetical protein SKAU_G00099550 [Synaphobranchus kaupii]|uniref:Protein phosphatase 1 regulatory subunit 19 n=1 Tax=Synaphobranchus kaupii TaxID=118154 RepID=A0A9Q1FYI7_SYNKA|nr:hypothetical protein SKAU_G00099550 [Synaphobranchus kaupii]
MSESHVQKDEFPHGVRRLQEEHKKVVTGCEEQVQHWKKVETDYNSLQERLSTLPDKLSYDIMVPFGPLAFMPGKLVHTNEVTVLLGDNWFAKCSAKQAVDLAEHRKSHVRKTLDDLSKVAENFEARVGFSKELEKASGDKGEYVDIREEVKGEEEYLTKGYPPPPMCSCVLTVALITSPANEINRISCCGRRQKSIRKFITTYKAESAVLS